MLVTGFATTGNAPKVLLLRGIGPSLSSFGVANFLSNPVMTLYDSSNTAIISQKSWDRDLISTFEQAGAFPLESGSNDAAFVQGLSAGAYTVQVTSGTSNSGIALAEIFDLNPGDPVNRLVNISARGFVGSGSNALVGGFVVGGTTIETLLIRADGPGLGAFGITGYLANPVLTVYDSAGQVIASVTGWGSTASNTTGPGLNAAAGMSISAATADEFTEVGSVPFVSGSADSAFVVSIPAGDYTAEVTGANGETGIALVEIYEVN
jgi:hypothetical protein